MVDEVIILFNYSLPVNVATTQVMKLNSHTIAIISASVFFHFSSVFRDDKNIFFLVMCILNVNHNLFVIPSSCKCSLKLTHIKLWRRIWKHCTVMFW